MTAKEALLKAAAVIRCDGDMQADCAITQDRLASGRYTWTDCAGEIPSLTHPWCASALLDGFSVEEVTAAEEELLLSAIEYLRRVNGGPK